MLSFLGMANTAFVGGSLVPHGGHNPLEASACGLSVMMGMSRYNFENVCHIMQDYQVIDGIKKTKDLIQCIQYRLKKNKVLKERIDKMFQMNGKNLEHLMSLIEQTTINN
jgi:3-deoxy-D-manno-octulosonic-acid transferase